MTDENFNGREQSDASFMEVLLALKQNVMRDLSVASFGVVKSVDDVFVKAKLFPNLKGEAEKTIVAVNCYGELSEGDIVVLLFADRNFTQNIRQSLKNIKMTDLDNDETLHSINFGIIIAKLYQGGENNASN